MISQLGNILQLLAMSCCLPAICSRKYYRPFFYASAVFIISAFLLLVLGFIISDFSLQNVFLNSSTLKPLIFKLAGAWASHEGSILLWLTLFSLVSVIFLRSGATFEHIIILASIELLFLIFIFFTSNPFVGFSFKPPEGLGLNPTLQDIALAIHPPILYLGYVAYAIPFTITCVILYKRGRHPEIIQHDFQELLQIAKRFSALGMTALTAGVGLGSWWAYRELGWGGFWFFDPVENISLLPWLSGIALYHSFSVIPAQAGQCHSRVGGNPEKAKAASPLYWVPAFAGTTQKHGNDSTAAMATWILSLSILTFLLSILGIFLVRSGIIISVHSFAFSPQRGLYILGIFTFLALGSVGLLAYASLVSSPRMRGPRILASPEWRLLDSRLRGNDRVTQGIILGNIVWLTAMVILLVSIIYPIVHYLLYKQSISIEEPYFIRSFIPVTLIAVLLAGAVPACRPRESGDPVKRRSRFGVFWIPAYAGMTLTAVLLAITLTPIVALVSSLFLMLATLYLALTKSGYLRKKLPARKVAGFIAHFGFGLLVLSITINALTKSEMEFIGKAGDTKTLGGLTVSLKNIRYGEGENYYRQIAEFWIYEERGNITTILKPENRLYKIENRLSQESDIYSYLTHDIYAVLSQIDGDTIQAKIYYRPLISFIWLAVILISSGFFITLINRN